MHFLFSVQYYDLQMPIIKLISCPQPTSLRHCRINDQSKEADVQHIAKWILKSLFTRPTREMFFQIVNVIFTKISKLHLYLSMNHHPAEKEKKKKQFYNTRFYGLRTLKKCNYPTGLFTTKDSFRHFALSLYQTINDIKKYSKKKKESG